jgi:hypothetical protein
VPRADPTIKAAALADLHSGEQPATVAEKYKLDPALVRKWKERHVTPAVTARDPATVTVIARPTVEAQQRQIGELVLDLLRAKLEASATIARLVANPEWLAGKSPAELVSLGNYLDDTALSLGDRLAGAGRPAEPDDGAGSHDDG